jgi:isoquinoline 1-oxidoreductase beta subunit
MPVARAGPAGAGRRSEVTHWIVIHPDDRVVIRVARSEMGQGASPASRSWSPRSSSATGTR